MRVEVVFASTEVQRRYGLELAPGATVETAIRSSGVLSDFPDIDLRTQRIGIFSRLVRLDRVLQDGDRVEIYRPLVADPKEARRRRADVSRRGR